MVSGKRDQLPARVGGALMDQPDPACAMDQQLSPEARSFGGVDDQRRSPISGQPRQGTGVAIPGQRDTGTGQAQKRAGHEEWALRIRPQSLSTRRRGQRQSHSQGSAAFSQLDADGQDGTLASVTWD